MSIYVPNGFKLLKTGYLDFILGRFKGELKELWEDYAVIHRTGLSGYPEPSNPNEFWHEVIEKRYSGIEVLSSLETSGEYFSANLKSRELRHEYYRTLRNRKLILSIENVDYSGEPTTYDRCLELLEGVEVYWERKKEELASAFREPFIDNFRRASALAADGTQMPIPPAWWCGSQCTEALLAMSCQHPLGDIIEKALSKAETNTAELRESEALDWLRANGETVKDWPDHERLDRFKAERPHFVISDKLWKRACRDFLKERPDLKPAFSKPGPRRSHR